MEINVYFGVSDSENQCPSKLKAVNMNTELKYSATRKKNKNKKCTHTWWLSTRQTNMTIGGKVQISILQRREGPTIALYTFSFIDRRMLYWYIALLRSFPSVWLTLLIRASIYLSRQASQQIMLPRYQKDIVICKLSAIHVDSWCRVCW